MEDDKKKKKKKFSFLKSLGFGTKKPTMEDQKKSKFFADNVGDTLRKRKKLLEKIK